MNIAAYEKSRLVPEPWRVMKSHEAVQSEQPAERRNRARQRPLSPALFLDDAGEGARIGTFALIFGQVLTREVCRSPGDDPQSGDFAYPLEKQTVGRDDWRTDTHPGTWKLRCDKGLWFLYHR